MMVLLVRFVVDAQVSRSCKLYLANKTRSTAHLVHRTCEKKLQHVECCSLCTKYIYHAARPLDLPRQCHDPVRLRKRASHGIPSPSASSFATSPYCSKYRSNQDLASAYVRKSAQFRVSPGFGRRALSFGFVFLTGA